MFQTTFKLKPPKGIKLPRGHPLGRGLVGCWLMNEGSGTKVIDLSGNRNNGTITGALWKPGKFGPCLSFDGSGDYVLLAITGAVHQLNSYSVKCWFNAPDSATVREIYSESRDDNSSTFLRFFLNDTGNVTLWIGLDLAPWLLTVTSPASYDNGVWHCAVGVRSGSTWSVYVDGVAVATSTSTAPVSAIIYKRNIGILHNNSGLINSFNGFIDDVQIWNRALSAGEIARLYREPFCMFDRPRRIGPMPEEAGATYNPTGFIVSLGKTEGSLGLDKYLQAKVETTGKVEASLDVAQYPQTKIASTGIVAGTISLAKSVVGKVESAATVLGDISLTLYKNLYGFVEASGRVLGNITTTKYLEGAIAASGIVAGAISAGVNVFLSGFIGATGIIAGALSLARNISGKVESLATVLGDITLVSYRTLSGFVKATGNVLGSITTTKYLEGAIAASGIVAGTIFVGGDVFLSGFVGATGIVAGVISVISYALYKYLDGVISATGLIKGHPVWATSTSFINIFSDIQVSPQRIGDLSRNLLVRGDVEVQGGFYTDGGVGQTTTFTAQDGRTVTVNKGIIIAIS